MKKKSATLDKTPPKFGGFFMPMIKPFGFINEVKEELSKITWPTREQTIRYTVLVIAVVIVVGFFLGGLDYILTSFTAVLVQKYGR